MMSSRRISALGLTLAAGLASTSQATIRTDPVKLRLVAPAPVVNPGDRVSLWFELVAKTPAMISRLEASSASLASPFVAKPAPQRVDAATPLRFPAAILFSENPEPLVIRFEVNGEAREVSVDLTALLASERAKRSAMVQVSAESVNPAGARPHLEQSLPVPTGEDDPEVTPLADRKTAPPSAQGRNIRVRGRVVYLHATSGKTIGADQLWVRAMDDDYGPDATLASGYTDSQGYFDMTFWWTGHPGDSEPDLHIKLETESPVVIVQSSTLEIEYGWDTPTISNYTGTDYQLGTWMPADQSTHGALDIYTIVRHDYTWYWGFEGISMPQVDVQWPDDESPYYDAFWEEIHLDINNTWKDFGLTHEYGHHFMFNFSQSPPPEYCNGYCDFNGDCSHCAFCEENGSVAVTEGFPDWLAYVQPAWYESAYGIRSFWVSLMTLERIYPCDSDTTWGDPLLTEGTFGAILQDIWDANMETDPSSLGTPDALALDWEEIFDVIRVDQPTSSLEFFQDFRARFPQYTVQLWQTANNNRLDLDSQSPSAVTGLVSTDHTPGVPSVDATIQTTWNTSTDDWSGVVSYDYMIDRPDPQPDTTFVVPGTVAATYHLPPGTYSIQVRARDRSGRTGPYAVAGPYVITTPTPSDLTWLLQPGWSHPVVPRPAADASVNNVPAPATLTGNAPTTYFNYLYMNAGQQAPLWGAQSWLLLDGGLLGNQFTATPNPGEVRPVVNRGPFTIRGGRHHIGGWLDTFDQWSESNEANNVWGRPWVWTPVPFTGGPGNAIRRSAPPAATAGWWTVKDGSPLYPSCDGIRWGATNSMNLVWMAADRDSSDFDLRLHTPMTGPNAGFDLVRGVSLRAAGCLEALMINRNVWNGDLNWDIGVASANGGGQTYVIARRGANQVGIGDGVWNYVLADSEYAALFAMWVGPNDAPVTVSALSDPSEGPFYLAHFTPSFAYGGLSDPSVTIHPADSTGLARFDILPPATGTHGVLLFRDPKDGRNARTIAIWAERTPGDLVAVAAPGWHSPVVPRPANDGTPSSVPQPTMLQGETITSYFNVSGRNVSIVGIPASFTGRVAVDAAPVLDLIQPSATPGQFLTSNVSVPVAVRGGRHTATVEWDFGALLPELHESNNSWGEQYVWSPQTLIVNTLVGRAAPPSRTAGWAEVRSGEPLYFNVDGLRTPTFAGGPWTWGGVAVMPEASSDVDLQLHEIATGAKDGFAGTLAVSAWGTGQSDYVLIAFSQTPRRAFDIGVANSGAGVEPYSAEAITSTVYPFANEYGPLTVGMNRTLQMIEVLVPAGSYTLRLLPVSATEDLGLSVHAATAAYQSKSDALATSWLNGIGEIEEVQFTAVVAAPYCFTVWKVGRADFAAAAEYELELIPNGATQAESETPPTTQLPPASPSPFGAFTTITFDLAHGGVIALNVYDVRGARVRSLAQGTWRAGRHAVRWDGHDDAGRRLGAGVYLVRLTASGRIWNRKVVQLE